MAASPWQTSIKIETHQAAPSRTRRPTHATTHPLSLAIGVAATLAGATLLAAPAASGQPPTPLAQTAALAAPGPLTEGDVIYQVLVDRFYNGNTANDNTGNGEFNSSSDSGMRGIQPGAVHLSIGVCPVSGCTRLW